MTTEIAIGAIGTLRAELNGALELEIRGELVPVEDYALAVIRGLVHEVERLREIVAESRPEGTR